MLFLTIRIATTLTAPERAGNPQRNTLVSRPDTKPEEGHTMQSETIGAATLETWTVNEVADAFAANEIVLIDVRTIPEYAFQHIEGAMLFPMPFFDAQKLPGQSDKRIVLHCGSGVRSEKMARAAIDAGLDRIAHMEGGFGAWKEAGKPYIGTSMSTGGPERVTA